MARYPVNSGEVSYSQRTVGNLEPNFADNPQASNYGPDYYERSELVAESNNNNSGGNSSNSQRGNGSSGGQRGRGSSRGSSGSRQASGGFADPNYQGDPYPEPYLQQYQGSNSQDSGQSSGQNGQSQPSQKDPQQSSGQGSSYNSNNNLHEASKMADTIVTTAPPVSPYGYGFPATPFVGGAYGNHDSLSDVVLANQISQVSADTVAAVNSHHSGIISAINGSGTRTGDQLSTGFANVQQSLCDVRHSISTEAAATRALVASEVCDLKHQLTLQTCELKSIFAEQENQRLRDRLQVLETNNLIQSAVAAATP